MIEIEEAVHWFNDCKPKYLRRFHEVTPKGNHIKGWICRKSNRFLGSLLIDELWGEPHCQFVQSMPKIDYYENERDLCLIGKDANMSFHDAVAYEKLDGSCLIIYPILDENGYIVEIVPKTRGKAVADSHFLELFNKVDKAPIWDYYGKNKGILFFEMYGILNQHDIIHYDTGIDIRLIGCYTTKFYKSKALKQMCSRHGFRQPDAMFNIGRRNVGITTEKYSWYFNDVNYEDRVAPSPYDAISKIQHFLEYLNGAYNDMNGRIATEGVVINCTDFQGRQKYIKVKPRDIENKHRSANGIPRSAIMKEVLKYFDDYGSEVEEIYARDKNHHTEYLHRMLLEDYNEEYVKKSSKKIEKVFMDVWDNKQVPESLQNIAEELFDEFSSQGITHCMRMFAQRYPMKKKNAKTIYQILEKLFARNGVDL